MQHSVKYIGEKYQKLSELRNDIIKFNALDFYNFALMNRIKYSLIGTDDDLLVSTWYSDHLINDYKALKHENRKSI